MQKNFIKCTPDSGVGNGTVTVTASQNTEDEITESITISGSGATKTISIHQEAIQQTVKVTEFTKNHFLVDRFPSRNSCSCPRIN